MKTKGREFTVTVEWDGVYFIGSVLELPGCHTQAKSLDSLLKRIKEAIAAHDGKRSKTKFVGVIKVSV